MLNTVNLLLLRALGTFIELISIKTLNLSQMYPRAYSNDIARVPIDSSGSLWPDLIWTPFVIDPHYPIRDGATLSVSLGLRYLNNNRHL